MATGTEACIFGCITPRSVLMGLHDRTSSCAAAERRQAEGGGRGASWGEESHLVSGRDRLPHLRRSLSYNPRFTLRQPLPGARDPYITIPACTSNLTSLLKMPKTRLNQSRTTRGKPTKKHMGPSPLFPDAYLTVVARACLYIAAPPLPTRDPAAFAFLIPEHRASWYCRSAAPLKVRMVS